MRRHDNENEVYSTNLFSGDRKEKVYDKKRNNEGYTNQIQNIKVMKKERKENNR